MAIGRINASLTGVQPGGLAKIVPTSVAVGSGSGSVDSNGNVTFSGASSVSLNDVFSATYQNYVISVSFTGTAAAYLGLRLRVSGSDASGGDYVWGFVAANVSGSSFVLAGTGATSSNISRFQNSANSISSVIFTIFRPFDAVRTTFHGTSFYDDGVNVATPAAIGGNHSLLTSYAGFTLLPASGNITGTIRVYGYSQ
jgi:hypothetical protein